MTLTKIKKEIEYLRENREIIIWLIKVVQITGHLRTEMKEI